MACVSIVNRKPGGGNQTAGQHQPQAGLKSLVCVSIVNREQAIPGGGEQTAGQHEPQAGQAGEAAGQGVPGGARIARHDLRADPGPGGRPTALDASDTGTVLA